MTTSQAITVLGFDYGTKKMGVAVGQTITLTANPLDCLPTIQGEPNWNAITRLIAEWRPNVLVVGLPLKMDRTHQHVTRLAKQFAAALRDKYGLPVHEVDERLTTVTARQMLFELGGYKALQKISVDSFAAKLIIEAWFHQEHKELHDTD